MSDLDTINHHGDGIRAGDRVQRPVNGVEKYQRRRLWRRLVQDGERTLFAYSADELIAIEGEQNMGRPGMPY